MQFSDFFDRDSTPHHVYVSTICSAVSLLLQVFKYYSRRHDRTDHIFPSLVHDPPCTRLISFLLFLALVRDRCCGPLLIYDCLIWARLCTYYLAFLYVFFHLVTVHININRHDTSSLSSLLSMLPLLSLSTLALVLEPSPLYTRDST